jgi:hypothetical protein
MSLDSRHWLMVESLTRLHSITLLNFLVLPSEQLMAK